jgi:MFS family permease
VNQGAPPRQLRRDIVACTGDGMTYSFMVGMGESYFAAYALALGFSDVVGGLIASVPYFIGACLQLIAPWGVERIGSPRRWVMLCAAVQASSFVPLVIGAVVGSLPMWMLFATVSLYWGSALGAGPAWNAWVGAVIPRAVRPAYFGIRSRLCQAANLAGILIAGGALAASGTDTDRAALANLIIFGAVFAMAGASRALSIRYLLRHSEPPRARWASRSVHPLKLLSRPLAGRERDLIIFMLVFQAAVQVSSPFFAPYMLRSLGWSMGLFLAAIAVGFAAKSLFMPMHGKYAARAGARSLLVRGSVCAAVASVLWTVSPSPWFVIPLQIFNAYAWGAYELATFLMMLELVHENERTSVYTAFNLLNSAAMAIGSLAGGWLLSRGESTFTAYMTLFAISSLLRAAALPLLLRVRDPREGTGTELPTTIRPQEERDLIAAEGAR